MGPVLFGGCLSEKEHQALIRSELTQVKVFADKLVQIRTSLPPTLTGLVACQSAQSQPPPVVDIFYLDTLSGEGKPETPAYTQLLRDQEVDMALLEALSRARTIDPEKVMKSTEDGVSLVRKQFKKTRKLAAHSRLAVVMANEFAHPECDKAGHCKKGQLDGWLVVFDQQTGKPLCYSPLEIASSDSIKTGGGIGLAVRVKGIRIPVPGTTLGATGPSKALQKDFRKQVEVSLASAFQQMSAVSSAGSGTAK